ncbi:sulfatase-like hydrolase/transferase [Luteolibacter algae]|uniref:Sulfatase-like hydrolase/transferase n=1 Tax=Luteolibacter algae TaxID=454151 RepID=A0ABW5D5G3_9BACT
MKKIPLLFLSISLFLGHAATAAEPEKPNIMFIFADDLTYEGIRAFGYTDIDTPNLDKLVSRGTTFTHAYNMGSWSPAVCMPSRAMLNTGRYVWSAKGALKTLEKERDRGVMWSQLMSKAGYRTYMTGKWHVAVDAESVFDVAAHVRGGMPEQTPEGYNRPKDGEPDIWSPYDKKFGGFWEGGTHWSEVLRDDALGFIDDAAKQEKPFFMYLAFNAPHDPHQAPKEYIDMYPEERIELPKSFLAEYPYGEDIGAGRKLRDERLAPWPRTEHSVKVNRAEYYALITHMDAQIGHILDALEASGKADNTVIFFSADHGLSCGHHGLLGKQNSFDNSTRVPFMMVGPGIPAGKSISQPIYYQDLMATSLALAGAEKPDHVDFQDLMPIIRGEKETKLEAVYGAYVDFQRSVTKDGWKLILYPNIKKALLFDLKSDPLEMNDMAGNPEQESRMKALFSALQKLQKENGDELDLTETYSSLAL